MDYQAIWDAAQERARVAANEVGARMGDGGSCGYAWVSIRPARGPFIAWLKSQNEKAEGDKPEGQRRNAYGEPFGWKPGWQIWNPGGYPGQCLCAKEAGALAFRRALVEAGIPGQIWDESRVD